MPDTSHLDKYLKANHVKDGEMVRFINGGNLITKEFKRNGKTEIRQGIDIEVELMNGMTKLFSINNMTRKVMEPVYGTNTDSWKGKYAIVKLVLTEVFGEMKNNVVLFPTEDVK